VDKTKEWSILRVRRELVEHLGSIHDGGESSVVHLIQDVDCPWEEDRVITDTGVLAASQHIGNDTPLSFLAFFGHNKERCVSQDFTSFFDGANYLELEELVHKCSCHVKLLGIHDRVWSEPNGWDMEKVLTAPFTKSVPMFSWELPPNKL
jgi:hypothetical protein